MQILIYGFKPYASYKTNITSDIVKSVVNHELITKKIFDVNFDAGMFDQTLAEVKPDVIIGLGQHPRARKLRLERKAKNLQRKDDGSIGQIEKNGPPARFANLTLPMTDLTTITYDAGTYVCNYSMYLMGKYSEKSGARFGFIHVPKDSEVSVNSRYLAQVIDNVIRGN
jgi:pyrrolidone-carboxylate peptidase